MSSPEAAIPSGTPHVLLVDDEEALRSLLEVGLTAHGLAVWSVSSGPKAVQTYRQHPGEIGVVLLDVQMPGMDGPQTLAALRALDPTLPCCFVSGGMGRYSEAQLLAAGAARVFRKPFDLDQIAAFLQQVSRPHERRTASRLLDRHFEVALAGVPGSAAGGTSWVKDRSPGGLGLWSSQSAPVGSVLGVRPTEAGEAAPWVQVEVRHCRPEGNGWTLGCRFLTLSGAEAALFGL